MNKKIITGLALFGSILMVSCSKQPTASPDTTESTVSEQTQEVTTQNTQTTTQLTTEAPAPKPVPAEAKRYTGTYTELMNSPKTTMTVQLEGDTFTAKLKVANNVSVKSVPTGEYSISFKYSDIKDSGDNSYTAAAKITAGNQEHDVSIIYYVQDGSVTGVTLNINNDSLELLNGSPL